MKKKIHLLLVFSLVSASSFAERFDSGASGYKPDPDARQAIKDELRRKEKSGELKKFWESYRDKTVASIKDPPPLGVPVNKEKRTVLVPAKFVFPKEFRNEKGQIVVSKGTVIEPLKTTPLSTGLVFIDGRDQEQVDYAIKVARQESAKIVLVAGSAYRLRIKYQNSEFKGGKGIPFYFDQRKMIINSLNTYYSAGIKTVPFVMRQSGNNLRFDFGL